MQKKYKTKLVLFDLDGTLIDTAPDFHNAINKILKKYNRTQISMSSVSYTHLRAHEKLRYVV